MTLGKIWYDIRLKNLIKVGFYSLGFWIDFHSFLTQLRMYLRVCFVYVFDQTISLLISLYFHFWNANALCN